MNYSLRDIEGLVNCSCSERLSALRLSQCSPNVPLPLPLLSVPASVLVPSGSLSLSLCLCQSERHRASEAVDQHTESARVIPLLSPPRHAAPEATGGASEEGGLGRGTVTQSHGMSLGTWGEGSIPSHCCASICCLPSPSHGLTASSDLRHGHSSFASPPPATDLLPLLLSAPRSLLALLSHGVSLSRPPPPPQSALIPSAHCPSTLLSLSSPPGPSLSSSSSHLPTQ